jgi:2-amino-4-hydroxy-6-hydroxymethyldihydropteridine diphosphokinase
MRYFLSLGSNLGDKRINLAHARALLKQQGVRILCASSLYRTQPLDCPGQPWFYNQVVEVSTPLNPHDLLGLIKGIEKRMGRKRSRTARPRPIDIDILLAEDCIIRTRRLTVPHPRIQKRNFVLVPFKEISRETLHPLLKKTILELWKESLDSSAVRKLKTLKKEDRQDVTQNRKK